MVPGEIPVTERKDLGHFSRVLLWYPLFFHETREVPAEGC